MSTNTKMSDSSHMNIRSAEKQKGGVGLSIRTKITFWAGLFLALVSLALVGYSAVTLRQASIDNSEKQASAIAEAKAELVKNQLDVPLLSARMLAYSLSANKDTGIKISLSRDEVNGMLRKVLIENPSFLGTYTLWEPNTFDGRDIEFAGAVAHDSTGRFIPYWVRGDDGIIHTEALTQYETPGVGDWYILPRSNKREVTIAPIFRRIQGQDVVIASFIIPIILDDTFYGIAGIDAPIGFVQNLVDDIDLYDGTANAVLFTDTGTLIAVRQKPELVNQPASLIYEDFDKISQLDSSFARISPDGDYLQIFSPIEIGGGEHWVLGLIIPFEKITAPATVAATRQVGIGTGLIALALFLLWLLTGQVVRPLQVLTNAATAVAQGDWSVQVNVRSNDEAETLANAFNTMTAQLQTLFGTLESRVAERTEALATVAEIGTATSTILEADKLLQEVVDLSKERFKLYHSHIYLLDEAGENLVLAAGAGEPGRIMVSEGRSIPLSREQSLVARAARERKGVTINDVTRAPDFLPNPLLPDTHSELAVPMIVGDKVLGVFDIQSEIVGRFTDADVNIQTTLAAQIAVSVQNARQVQQSIAIAAELSGFQNAVSASSIIATTDVTGKIETVNDQFILISKYPREELIGQDHRILNSGYHPKEFMRDLWVTIANGKVWRNEIRNKAKDGSFYWVDTTIAPILNAQGKPIKYVAIRFDITQRKELELEVAKRAALLGKLDAITQKIQSTTKIENALQIAARELGHAVGMKSTAITLNPEDTDGKRKDASNN